MLKKGRMAILILFFCMFAVLPSGCSQSPNMAKSDEIVIGVAWPFSSGNDLFNEGIDLAAKEINENGGINHKKLRLMKKDDGSDEIKGLSIAQSFAADKSVIAVIGHRNSYVSIPASAVYEKAGLTMLSPASTAPELTQNNYTYIFRNIPNDDEITRNLASYLANAGHRRMVIYYSTDSYGTGLADSFEDQAKSCGITIVDRFDYYSGSSSLKSLYKRWRAFSYDGIFIATGASAGAKLINDCNKSGISGPFAAGNALDSSTFINAVGTVTEETIVGSVFNSDSKQANVKSFVTAFQNKYHKLPGSYSALGYDAVRMLAAAIEKSKTKDRASVANELKKLGKWQGVCGTHLIDKTGNDTGDLVVLKKLCSGKFTCFEK